MALPSGAAVSVSAAADRSSNSAAGAVLPAAAVDYCLTEQPPARQSTADSALVTGSASGLVSKAEAFALVGLIFSRLEKDPAALNQTDLRKQRR
jgi:hypothetical protein